MPRSPFSDAANELIDRLVAIMPRKDRHEIELYLVQISLNCCQWIEMECRSPSARKMRKMLREGHRSFERLSAVAEWIEDQAPFISVMGPTATAEGAEMVREYLTPAVNPADEAFARQVWAIRQLKELGSELGRRADRQPVSRGNLSAMKIAKGTVEQKLAIACCYFSDHFGVKVTSSSHSKVREITDIVYEFVMGTEPNQEMKEPLEFACKAYKKAEAVKRRLN